MIQPMHILFCLGMLLASSVDGGVFRCRVSGGGAITWQNQPCPAGSFQREQRVEMPPPPDFFTVSSNVEVVARPPVRVVPLMDPADPAAPRASP